MLVGDSYEELLNQPTQSRETSRNALTYPRRSGISVLWCAWRAVIASRLVTWARERLCLDCRSRPDSGGPDVVEV